MACAAYCTVYSNLLEGVRRRNPSEKKSQRNARSTQRHYSRFPYGMEGKEEEKKIDLQDPVASQCQSMTSELQVPHVLP